MKFAEVQEYIIWKGIHKNQLYEAAVIGEHFSVRPGAHGGGIVKQTMRKGAAAVKANPGLAALSAGLAVASYTAYTKNKRNTMRLFAKGQKEKQLYKKIISDLMKTGFYKKVREKYTDGGYLWVLKRT